MPGKTFPLAVTVLSARLNSGGGFLGHKAPDTYVEVSVDSDGGQVRRSGVKKRSTTPQWDEQLPALQVSESSVLEFAVLNKAKLFEDTMLGRKSVKLSHWIKKESENGKCGF